MLINAPDSAIRNAILNAEEMWSDGIVGFVPNCHVFQDLVSPRPDEDWLLIHSEYLRRCDAVLHMANGSEPMIEVAVAEGKPIFNGYKDLYDFSREGADGQ